MWDPIFNISKYIYLQTKSIKIMYLNTEINLL